MRQLTSLDMQFLALESDDPDGARRRAGDPRPVDRAERRARLRRDPGAAARSACRCCRRSAGGWPRCRSGWTTRTGSTTRSSTSTTTCASSRCPKPGSDAQLAAQVARIISRPLDRKRPLWELYLIHGLKSGHTAMLTKIHHALIDGLSGAEIMGLLLDLSPEGRGPGELPEPTAGGAADNGAGTPGTAEMLARGLMGVPRYPLRMLRSLPSAVPHIEDTPFGVLPGASTVGKATDPRRASSAAASPRSAAQQPGRAAHVVQRPHHAAPPLLVRAAVARRGQGGQERLRVDRQRRGRVDLRRARSAAG